MYLLYFFIFFIILEYYSTYYSIILTSFKHFYNYYISLYHSIFVIIIPLLTYLNSHSINSIFLSHIYIDSILSIYHSIKNYNYPVISHILIYIYYIHPLFHTNLHHPTIPIPFSIPLNHTIISSLSIYILLYHYSILLISYYLQHITHIYYYIIYKPILFLISNSLSLSKVISISFSIFHHLLTFVTYNSHSSYPTMKY